MVTVTREKYIFKEEGSDDCVAKANEKPDYYAKNTIEYTSRSPWPYNDYRVCSTYYEVKNDDTDRESEVTFYTYPDGYKEDPSPVGAVSATTAVALCASLMALAF